jgi:hypothetical protein
MKRLIRSIILPAAAPPIVAAFILLTAPACDDTPQVPQSVLDEANKPKEADSSKRPATQELLGGRRTRTALVPLPLTMEVPQGWGQGQFKDIPNPGNLLQGYTPAGDVQIDLAARPSLKQEQLDQLLEGAKKETAKNPTMKVELRSLGDVKVLERRSVGQPRPLEMLDSRGQPYSTVDSILKWTISVLVPQGGAYQVYELNFMGLTKSQYDKDKQFLEGILSTIQYAGDSGSGGGGGAASLPPPTTTAVP